MMERDKKEILRNKSLEHYYQNIPYYREYYVRNKEKLLKYNREYKNKCANITFQKPFCKNEFKIIKGSFTLHFD
jgi:hypothetical protein